MNRLNKTESAIFLYCRLSLFLNDLFSIILNDDHGIFFNSRKRGLTSIESTPYRYRNWATSKKSGLDTVDE